MCKDGTTSCKQKKEQHSCENNNTHGAILYFAFFVEPDNSPDSFQYSEKEIIQYNWAFSTNLGPGLVTKYWKSGKFVEVSSLSGD